MNALLTSISRVCTAVFCASRGICKAGCRPSNRYFVTMVSLLDKVLDADLDSEGDFKYILIEVTNLSNGDKKRVVRGYSIWPYHADMFDSFLRWLATYGGMEAQCLGGGRIKHDPVEKIIKVYGLSEAFGKANHAETVEILKKRYTDYKITMSNRDY